MFLEKEDVSLYYEVRGEGEPLILIHGLIVDAELFENTAEILSRSYKVITFDRRGNSRSRYKDGAAARFSMEAQSEDIKDLMNHLEIESAYIAGASAGATLGQYFLSQYQERVKHLIMYEPAILSLMVKLNPETDKWVKGMEELIAKKRFNTLLLRFAESIGQPDPRSPARAPENSIRQMENMEYAFTQEFPGLIKYEPDYDNMEANAEKITVAAGEKSEGTTYRNGAGIVAEMVGRELLYFPGGHNMPFELPKEFAVSIAGTLALIKD